MARRRRLEPENHNHDRWLISYADFITLLFAFFVVLYALSSVNQGKYKVLSDSLITAFKTEPRAIQPIQVGEISRAKVINIMKHDAQKSTPDTNTKDNPEKADNYLEVNLQEMADKIEHAMDQLINQDLVKVRRSKSWLEIEINSSLLFNSGNAKFVKKSASVLKDIAKIMKSFPNPVNVEGFTDNVPIKNEMFPSNWVLSAARAASVVHIFEKNGVAPERMTAIGYGEYRPIADNTSPSGRRKNRRVVLAVLAENKTVRIDKRTSQPLNAKAREKAVQ